MELAIAVRRYFLSLSLIGQASCERAKPFHDCQEFRIGEVGPSDKVAYHFMRDPCSLYPSLPYFVIIGSLGDVKRFVSQIQFFHQERHSRLIGNIHAIIQTAIRVPNWNCMSYYTETVAACLVHKVFLYPNFVRKRQSRRPMSAPFSVKRDYGLIEISLVAQFENTYSTSVLRGVLDVIDNQHSYVACRPLQCQPQLLPYCIQKRRPFRRVIRIGWFWNQRNDPGRKLKSNLLCSPV
jgi:hypothetical protein